MFSMKLNDFSEQDLIHMLSSDGVDQQKQLSVLVFLEEEHSTLMATEEMVEQVIGTLWDLFHQLKPLQKLSVVKRQLLVTITTILLGQENLVVNAKLRKMFVALTSLLLNNAADVNKNPCLLREVCCHCLIEIEEHFPGLLVCHLDKLKFYCKQECSFVFQSYANLYTLALKNQASQEQKSHRESELADLKKAFNQNDLEIFPLSTEEYNEMVIFLVDHVTHLTEPATYRLLQSLVPVIKSSNINPSILKPIFLQCMATFDISLFHLIFQLKDSFGYNLLSKEDTEMFWIQLGHNANHPLWQIEHRDLLFSWLHNISKEIATHSVLPLPSDELCTLSKKIALMCKLVPQDEICALVCTCLSNFQIRLKHSKDQMTAVIFYKILFNALMTNKNLLLSQIIHRFAMDTFCNHPQFAKNVMEYVDSVKLSFFDSDIEKMLTAETERCITSLSLDKFLKSPTVYLIFLKNAANKRIMDSQTVLIFMSRLLETSLFRESDDWSSGHALLSLCQSLMMFPNMQSFYKDLAEILYIIGTEFKDADVQDRAQLYYLITNSLSNKKLSSLFKLKSDDSNASHSLNTIITGGSTYSFPLPVVDIDTPLLKLSRVNPAESCNSIERYEVYADALERHTKWINGDEFVSGVQFNYNLSFTKDVVENNLKNLYGIEIICWGEKHFGIIEDVSVPWLSQANGDRAITITLKPTKPLPGIVEISVVFSSSTGCTYRHVMPSLHFNLEDFFQEFPVPDNCCQSAFRKQLFPLLWDQLLSSGSQQSVYCFNATAAKVTEIVSMHLNAFVMDTTKTAFPMPALGIYLHPKNYLLMKFSKLGDLHTVVSVLSNYCDIFPLLNRYFVNLENLAKVLQ